MKLHIIGSGCPTHNKVQFGSCFILETKKRKIMIDCGPASTYKLALMNIRLDEINHVFFTHHHYDHNVDFACFALTKWDQQIGTEPSLNVYGPHLTKAYVDQLFGRNGAFYSDYYSRVTHPVSIDLHAGRGGILPRPIPKFYVEELESGAELTIDEIKVKAMVVHHVEPTLISLAYRFETPEGSVLFSGDCGDCPALRSLSTNTDNLVLTCTHFGSVGKNAYLRDVITGTKEVASIITETNPKRIVLSHASPNFVQSGIKEKAVSVIAREAPAFTGEICFPFELNTVDL